jgi:SAM-dependent methyltransferase
MAGEASQQPLFDLAAEYDAMLSRGIGLSGEDRLFFMRGRVADLAVRVPRTGVRRILDFGCGIGDTSSHLAEVFPGAQVLGVDGAERALAWARERHGSPRVRFARLDDFVERDVFDLCYVNGVFHHIDPERRPDVAKRLLEALASGGRLALFENNPWNPGTRLVMRRIPFDRDAVPLAPPSTRRLLRHAGFECGLTRFLFYFPRPLAVLRPTERFLARVPLGAQYYVLATRPAGLGHGGEPRG